MKKPNRKFTNRKAKIKQYKTDVTMAIRELVKEMLLEAGWPEKHVKSVSFEAGREETKYIVDTAKNLIQQYEGGFESGSSVAAVPTRFPV